MSSTLSLDIKSRVCLQPSRKDNRCKYQQTDSNIYTERRKIQISQHNNEGDQQNLRADTTWHQHLVQSYSNQDSVILAKE